MIPDVSAGEDFEEALARSRLCINGGGEVSAGDGYNSDLEVVADSFAVNLRCPISGSRMKVAGRFKPCLHMGCFDLHTFVELNQRARKWQCPICLKNYALENLIIDPFLSRITSALKYHPEDVTEVEMKADGHWRIKGEKSCERWHSPDDSIVPRGSLGIGMKRKHYGQWAIDESVERLNGQALSNMAGPSQKAKLAVPAVEAVVISQSSIGADSNEENLEDGESRINQEPSKKDMEAAQSFEDDEASHLPKGKSKGTTWPSRNRSTEPEPMAAVIVLSDTDDEDGDNLGRTHVGTSVHTGSDTMTRPVSARSASSRSAQPQSLSTETREACESQVLVNPWHEWIAVQIPNVTPTTKGQYTSHATQLK